ncbi:hypothetical protein ACFQU1_17820 [Chelatococcus sp. GCM10030263]|uniref:hypothetical protein n=1 Tax=Chelatococcus sp. GCM10030263 TaxID=3273387 RepID=UPI003611AE2D
MHSRLLESGQAASARHTYPQMDPATLAALNAKLIEIVSLLHRQGLSAEQLTELTSAVAIQTANAERLHRFPLRNADEPAFTVFMPEMAARER